MNRKISVGMTVTIVILAMTVTFSITMLMAMRLFDHTVTSVKEKESMYNKVAEVDRYVRANDYYDIDETMLYDRLTAGYLLGTGDKYARYYTAAAYTDLLNAQSGKLMGIGVELAIDQSGYAKVSNADRERWDDLINSYFEADSAVCLLVQLLDSRHAPSADDVQMMEYLHFHRIPFVVALTKADKVFLAARRACAQAAPRTGAEPAGETEPAQVSLLPVETVPDFALPEPLYARDGTVFLQQLGRGLRLAENKDCLTVLDFIGQANKKYNFEEKFAALLSNTTRSVSRELKEGFVSAPKGC